MNDEKRSIIDLISLDEAAQFSGYSDAYVRRLVEKGKLWGIKIGRDWITTRKDMEQYMSQEHPRGRKPKGA